MIEYRKATPSDAEMIRGIVLSCIKDFTGIVPEAYPKIEGTIQTHDYDKDLRTFFLIFRGGSLRILSPTRDPNLTIDVDSATGTLRYARVDDEGRVEWGTVVMEEPEA